MLTATGPFAFGACSGVAGQRWGRVGTQRGTAAHGPFPDLGFTPPTGSTSPPAPAASTARLRSAGCPWRTGTPTTRRALHSTASRDVWVLGAFSWRCAGDCGRTFSETSSQLPGFFVNEFERLSIAFGKAPHPYWRQHFEVGRFVNRIVGQCYVG